MADGLFNSRLVRPVPTAAARGHVHRGGGGTKPTSSPSSSVYFGVLVETLERRLILGSRPLYFHQIADDDGWLSNGCFKTGAALAEYLSCGLDPVSDRLRRFALLLPDDPKELSGKVNAARRAGYVLIGQRMFSAFDFGGEAE